MPFLRTKRLAYVFCSLFRTNSDESWAGPGNEAMCFVELCLVCTPFNSTKTLFSYNMRHNGLHDRTRQLDAIIEMELSHIWPYLHVSTPKMAPTLESGYINVITKFLSPYTQMVHFGGI